MHSDKTGKDDEDFKELVQDYNTLLDALKDLAEEGECVEKSDLQKFFEKHNFAKEFSKTWTIFIEKEKINEWKNIMNKRFPGGKPMQGNGIQFLTRVDDGNVFTTLYDVVVPKMNIQGKQTCLRKFVMEILPDIYRDVTGGVTSSESNKIEKVPISARVKLSGETIFTCGVCEKKYMRKAAMKKHMQTKHGHRNSTEGDNSLGALCFIDQKNENSVMNHPVSNIRNQLVDKECLLEEGQNTTEAEEITLDEAPEIREEIGPEKALNMWQCGECARIFDIESDLKEHIDQTHCGEQSEDDLSIVKKRLETIQRRHEQLKQKYEQSVKDNKVYAKSLFDTLQENSALKDKAERDAETLADTLSVNQVLMEEIKVKDAIIEANEKLTSIRQEKEDEETSENWIRCNKCDFKSTNPLYIAGHELKHSGQYICAKCKIAFKVNKDLKEHNQQKHAVEQIVTLYECESCEKTFTTQPALKQHKTSKHQNNYRDRQNLPVGHPERIAEQERVYLQRLNISCAICGGRFQSQSQLEDHMKEHTTNQQSFERQNANKPCRYFRRGYCAKGNQCAFQHNEHNQNYTPACNQGNQCRYLYWNRCSFFHPGVGVQKPQNMQDFRVGMRNNRPPMNMMNMNAWMDY